MLYAIDEKGDRTKPSPKKEGTCPACGGTMIPKCGEKMVWHWAHKTGFNDCDEWYESITEWHEGWMNRFDESSREVLIGSKAGSEKHVIDICTEDGIKVDFQSERITVNEMERRDSFWNGAFWVLDARKFFGGLQLKRRNSGHYYAFEVVEGWHYPEETVRSMMEEILSLNGKLAVAANYVSLERKKKSNLVFELWTEDKTVRSEVLEAIRKINSRHMRSCLNRRTPWVLESEGTAKGSGMWLENSKGVKVGHEYGEMMVYVDEVEGAEGMLFRTDECELVGKDAFVEMLKFDPMEKESI